jgi:hypothetical protein
MSAEYVVLWSGQRLHLVPTTSPAFAACNRQVRDGWVTRPAEAWTRYPRRRCLHCANVMDPELVPDRA